MAAHSDRPDEWISWAEAADLVGIPVRRIEWWKRQGRIEHRPEDKRRPTLRRTSVEEFASWYRQREERLKRDRTSRDQRSDPHGPPAPTGWLSSREAADWLGIRRRSVIKHTARLGGLRRGQRLWFPVDAVETFALERRERRVDPDADWISLITAAEIIGCHASTVLRYVKWGTIRQRQVDRPEPSLDRESVAAFAARWRADAARHQYPGARRRVR